MPCVKLDFRASSALQCNLVYIILSIFTDEFPNLLSHTAGCIAFIHLCLEMDVFPAGAGYPLCPDSLRRDFAPDISMRSRIVPVDRLQRSGVNDPIPDKRLGPVYMPHGNVVKSALLQHSSVHRNMLFIPAMGEQDLVLLPACGRNCIVERLSDLPAVIAQSIHRSLKLRKFHILGPAPEQRNHVPTPPECAVIRIVSYVIMIPRDKDYLRAAQL